MTQDPKFSFSGGRVYHTGTNEPIPEDEPLCVFRGKDEVALLAMMRYVEIMDQYPSSRLAQEHAASMQERVAAFARFQEDHPDRVGMGCHTCEHAHDRERLHHLHHFAPIAK